MESFFIVSCLASSCFMVSCFIWSCAKDAIERAIRHASVKLLKSFFIRFSWKLGLASCQQCLSAGKDGMRGAMGSYKERRKYLRRAPDQLQRTQRITKDPRASLFPSCTFVPFVV